MITRLVVVLALTAIVLGVSWAWRRREGRFSEAGGAFDRGELGLARGQKPSAVVVEFGGEHCGSCRIVEQRLAKLSTEIPDVHVVTIDVEDQPALAKRYGVTRVPTLFVTDPELQIHWRASGVPTEDAVRKALLGPEWAGRPHPTARRHALRRASRSRRVPRREERTITLVEDGVTCEVAPPEPRR